jgi:SAM-dependent methyltransferase
MTDLPNPPLKQRDRAAIDFIAWLGLSVPAVRAQVDRDLTAAGVSDATLPAEVEAISITIEAALADSAAFRVQQMMGEWHARNHGPTAVAAFEALADEITPALTALDEGPATLEWSDAPLPDYWAGVDFHRTKGGWDGHPYMGFIHGEYVHKRMVDKLFPGGIFRQRLHVAGLTPRRDYKRILDLGCSTGHFTLALAEVHPGAEIHGVDLSPRTLDHARRVANARGLGWRLRQAPAEATGYPDAHFDLVASYILLHELPPEAVRAVFAESFRLLEPGGDLLFSDVTRTADLDPIGRWRADHGARFGGEPHWRASAALDLKAIAEAAGFTQVEAWGEKPFNYPYVVRARKPA